MGIQPPPLPCFRSCGQRRLFWPWSSPFPHAWSLHGCQHTKKTQFFQITTTFMAVFVLTWPSPWGAWTPPPRGPPPPPWWGSWSPTWTKSVRSLGTRIDRKLEKFLFPKSYPKNYSNFPSKTMFQSLKPCSSPKFKAEFAPFFLIIILLWLKIDSTHYSTIYLRRKKV